MTARWRLARKLAGLGLADEHPVDVYMAWDQLTGQARHRQGQHWPVMVECAGPDAGDALDRWLRLPEVAGRAAGLRQAFEPSLAHAPGSTIHTALLPTGSEACLAAGVRAGLLRRFQLGARCEYRAPQRPPPARGQRLGRTGHAVILGVIDDGCCFAHEAFRGPGGCRVRALWDQAPAAEPTNGWAPPASGDGQPPYRYGVELLAAELDALLEAHPQRGEAAERRLYDSLGRPDWGRPSRTHGARVLHLLAGRRTGPAGQRTGPAGHDAGRMPVVFVQLPQQTVGDATGDSLGMHVLDGARYIVEQARALAAGRRKWRVVINISLGSIAGPHDGTSMAELGLAGLAADPHVTLVMAAGNTAGDGARIHAQQTLRRGAPGSFVVRVPPALRRDSFVELWLDTEGGATADDYEVRVVAPGGAASAWIVVGQATALAEGETAPMAALVFPRRTAQGQHDTMVLLSVAPTQMPPGRAGVAAPSGFWTVEMRCNAAQPVTVHGWVERDDTVIGARRPQQARFEVPTRDAQDPSVNDDNTLSNLANAPGLLRVGGYVKSADKVAAYSANGPLRMAARRGVPEVEPTDYAPSDRSFWLPGIGVPGFFSGTHSAISGTSAAAPQVARVIAERRPTPVGPPRRLPRPARAGRPLPAHAFWHRLP